MAKQLHAVRHYCGRFRAVVNYNHQRSGRQMLHVLFK
ncbi:Uncharacterised protein [Enterobacter hormaechei]|nr:Uncharacterised protein [Enterobacter hormaechei]SAH46161.1 Uncharacterised protein [Enterobacter hormaechei]